MKYLILLLLIICASTPILSQEGADAKFKARIETLPTVINDPKKLDTVFSPALLSAVSPEKLTETFRQLRDTYGDAVKVTKIEKDEDYSRNVTIEFSKGFELIFATTLAAEGDHLVQGLLVTSVQKISSSIDEIISDLTKLSGRQTFLTAKLDGADVEKINELNASEPFAIGSTFKLYVLAQLQNEINRGERDWADVVALEEKSFPTGMLQEWRKGSPLTFNTLASLMISISDNTATDQLIENLGRENIEKMLVTAGNTHAEKNLPFLKTSEMFKIKGLGDGSYAETYATAGVLQRTTMLNSKIANGNLDDIDLNKFLKKPTYINEIEWFASSEDLARVMGWFVENTRDPDDSNAMGALTINKALDKITAAKWNYVGYKGGSEPGVISMTYLLQAKSGDWYVLTASWNDAEKVVNDGVFVGIIQKAVSLFADSVSK
ncbi:MAG: serine hydrolase [Pyrinomonadaceae bacterium]